MRAALNAHNAQKHKTEHSHQHGLTNRYKKEKKSFTHIQMHTQIHTLKRELMYTNEMKWNGRKNASHLNVTRSKLKPFYFCTVQPWRIINVLSTTTNHLAQPSSSCVQTAKIYPTWLGAHPTTNYIYQQLIAKTKIQKKSAVEKGLMGLKSSKHT